MKVLEHYSFPIHNKLSPNLELYLSQLQVEYFWNNISSSGNIHELIITKFPDGMKQLILRSVKEFRNYGFIPYHYCLDSVSYKGKSHDKEDRISFIGTIKSYIEFKNSNGDFYLIHIEDENQERNYIWKRYKMDIESMPTGKQQFTGRLKAVVTGYNKEKLNLINYVRVKNVYSDNQ